MILNRGLAHLNERLMVEQVTKLCANTLFVGKNGFALLQGQRHGSQGYWIRNDEAERVPVQEGIAEAGGSKKKAKA